MCVVEKDLSNIPGGVAYGKKTSIHGYFNNPLRLSQNELQKYYKNISNFKKLYEYIKKFGSNYDIKKYQKNLEILKSKKPREIMEIYLPRVAFSYMQEKNFINILKKIKNRKKNIHVDFYQGEVINFKDFKNSDFEILSKKNFIKFSLNSKSFNNSIINFTSSDTKIKKLYCKNLTIGLGITPPQKLTKSKIINNNYIWDFYAEGGTSTLVNKLKKKINTKNNVKLCFIGSKAGFLESLQEIYSLKKKHQNLKIYCFSKRFESLQPAIYSFKKKVKLKFLKKGNSSVSTAKKLYELIHKELTFDNSDKNMKYLIWTEILSKNILEYFLNKLSHRQIFIYQTKYFQKIRSLTRFTFPETIKVKDTMIKNKMIKILNEKANKIVLKKNSININGDKKKYSFDIVVNVTGPCDLVNSAKHLPIYRSILKFANAKKNLLVSDKFSVIDRNNLFSPGTISQGFNDKRQTIIKAIINNSKKSSDEIFKRISRN